MRAQSNKTPLWVFGVFVLLFSLQVVPRFWWDSLTNDEPSDITNGYYYLTRGDVVTPHNHPPLAGALNALPLLFMNLKVRPLSGDVIDRGHYFIFQWNLGLLEQITFWARFVSWGLGCILGLLLFWVTRQDISWSVGVLLLWAFNPTLTALSGLAKTDIAPCLFFFLAVLLFRLSKAQDSSRFYGLTGVVAAMAVTTKFYCLVLIPVFMALEFLQPEKSFALWRPKGRFFQALAWRWLWGTAGFFAWIFLLYLPASLLLPDHREPFGYFFSKFKEDLVFAHNPFPVFFLGTSGLESHWYYLPIAFLVKEPLPFLFLVGGGIFLALTRRIVLPAWEWVPPLFFFLALLPTLNLGVRYLLPALPFLLLIAAKAGAWMWRRWGKKVSSLWRWGVAGLCTWQMVSVGLNFPHPLSYFNEWVAPDRKIQFLADSNLDWGQDLKRLAGVGRERHWNKVKLAYLGGVDPAIYGLDWEPWQESDLNGPQPGKVYAVNASFLQLAPVAYPPTRAIAQGWISQAIPTGKVADSWYFYEMPGSPRGTSSEKSWLASVPFLQYRGYTDFSPAPQRNP